MTIEEILNEVYTKNSIYDEIIDNMIYPRTNQKYELLSEISLNYLQHKEKIEKIYDEGYFKYYFINTVRNQFRSNTSSFHKTIRITNDIDISDIPEIYNLEDTSTTIDEKIKLEEKLSVVNEIKSNCGISWFENQMLREYYDNDKTYRKIEQEYGLDHCLVFKTVKGAIKKIVDYKNK